MIPSTFVVLGSLPRTTSGKTDHQALPEPGRPYRDPHRPPTPPSTPLEAAVAKIWSSVMRLEAIDVHDHFYDLGGESLQAMRIMAGVRKAFSVDIDLQSLPGGADDRRDGRGGREAPGGPGESERAPDVP